ncbi:MAG TPA: sigma-70 family RNA polymerase sigma factor [Cellvibrionaceae bacterium]
MDISDQQLIERVVATGDHHAYAQLVRRYQSRLRLSLRNQCGGDEALADDIAQDAFIKAYKALAGFKQEAQFFTWLYQIARNQLMSHYRKKQPLLLDDEPTLNQDMAMVTVADDNLAGRDLKRALEQLSDQQREAIYLTYQLGHSNEEVAELMQVPLGTLKSHILRGKAKLKELLHDWQGESFHEPG